MREVRQTFSEDDFKNRQPISERTYTAPEPTPKKRRLNAANLAGLVVGILFSSVVGSYVATHTEIFSSSSLIDKTLMAAASEINKGCPMMVDEITQLDNTVALPGKQLLYNYTIISVTADDVDTLQFKEYLRPLTINNMTTNPDMKKLKDMEVTLVYYYKDKEGKYLLKYSLTPEEYSSK